MGKITKIEQIPPEELIPYERNAKQHPQEQVEKIVESIKEFGFLSPCLIDKDKNIIAGHGRVEAAKKLGLETVPCVFIEGLTEAQRRAYILADNRLTELGGWDMELVQTEIKELEEMDFDISLTGFEIEEIESEEIEEDDFDDTPPEEPKSKRGDIYKLGRHRLMCGDSTSIDDVQKLVADNVIDLLITDPPYNVNYGNVRDLSEAIKRRKRRDGLIIQNDDMDDDKFRRFLIDAFSNADSVMRKGAVFYIWHADNEGYNFRGMRGYWMDGSRMPRLEQELACFRETRLPMETRAMPIWMERRDALFRK